MRGLLSFQILWLLSRKEMHGEEIAREIEKRRGEKPKAGTIYPALKELHASGLISGKKSGKLITYSLTPEGKHVIKMARAYFIRCFGDIMAR
ncbi:MAG: PadR family transcriptional regulator [Candidatus Micrarchaeota archaeon]|nr:PadR family transcriptional regulator [Candidatus Micrarchaeota archaeon]